MSEKYIRENKNSFVVSKGSRSYGKFEDIDDAIFVRDILIENDWNPVDGIYETKGRYVAVATIDEKAHILGKFGEMPSQKTIDDLTKRKIRNPNNSKYGLNITRVFDTFIIKKQIAGQDHIFGYYDCLEDAEFVRNFLMDNMWNVNAFSQIQFDADTDTYRVVEVIDERAYVLDTFKSRDEIDLKRVHEEFLSKISKHKFGLASHPYLDELKDELPELEKRFNASPNDDVWSFEDTQDPLNDIIFNLTPFQKAVYDSLDGEKTFDEIMQALARFKSKNFESKVQRNLDELIKKGLVCKDGVNFKKTK